MKKNDPLPLGEAGATAPGEGLSLSRWYPELRNARLLCVTEATSREQIDAMVRGLTA